MTLTRVVPNSNKLKDSVDISNTPFEVYVL